MQVAAAMEMKVACKVSVLPAYEPYSFQAAHHHSNHVSKFNSILLCALSTLDMPHSQATLAMMTAPWEIQADDKMEWAVEMAALPPIHTGPLC